MKTIEKPYTFVYKARSGKGGTLHIPKPWSAAAVGGQFRVKAVSPGRFLFSPVIVTDADRLQIQKKTGEEMPPDRICLVKKDGSLAFAPSDFPLRRGYFFAGLGDSFLLTDRSAGRVRCSGRRLRRAMDPVKSAGRGICRLAKLLRPIRSEYDLYTIALLHSRKTMAGLAAAALKDPLLRICLVDACAADAGRRSIAIYAAACLRYEEVLHCSARYTDPVIRAMASVDFPRMNEQGRAGFRIRRVRYIKGPGYYANALSDCRYEEKDLKRLKKIRGASKTMSFACRSPFHEVYEESLWKLREYDRPDMLLWFTLFSEYTIDSEAAMNTLKLSQLSRLAGALIRDKERKEEN